MPQGWSLPNELCERMIRLRRDLHAHPELRFSEFRTAGIVAERLRLLGLDVITGIGSTGVVGRLLASPSANTREIGLRADLDALPIEEKTGLPHRSAAVGVMHACGHDGHVAMLLGAAELLVEAARAGKLQGCVDFVFQPGEEGGAGAQRMLNDGLLEYCPMDSLYGLHNWPTLRAGAFRVMHGPIMAGTGSFEMRIRGRGGHAAMPHLGDDSILAGAALVQAIQHWVTRANDPSEPLVISVARFHGGTNNTVLPDEVVLGGTARAFSTSVLEKVRVGLRSTAEAIACLHRVEIEVNFKEGYPPVRNCENAAAAVRDVVVREFGPDALETARGPSMAADDFGYFCDALPSCYVWLGSGEGAYLHSPVYDFNDEVLPVGIRYWVELALHLLGQAWAARPLGKKKELQHA